MSKQLSDIDKTYNVIVDELNKRNDRIVDLLNERNKLALAANALIGTEIFLPLDIKAAKTK